jgi:hypothetical protein
MKKDIEKQLVAAGIEVVDGKIRKSDAIKYINTHGITHDSEGYGLRWFEFDKSNRKIQKEKYFKLEKDRDKFVDKLVEKDNFAEMGAFSDPKTD